MRCPHGLGIKEAVGKYEVKRGKRVYYILPCGCIIEVSGRGYAVHPAGTKGWMEIAWELMRREKAGWARQLITEYLSKRPRPAGQNPTGLTD